MFDLSSRVTVRPADKADQALVEAIYPAAFPEEDLLPLVGHLFDSHDCLHFVAVDGDDLVGHVAFTLCGAGDAAQGAALLAPLAVAPSHHRQGIGSALVNAGFAHLVNNNVQWVLVLGDPNYYSRFGFRAETEIMPPCPIPDEWASAWQSVQIAPGEQVLRGNLSLPDHWLDPALWAP